MLINVETKRNNTNHCIFSIMLQIKGILAKLYFQPEKQLYHTDDNVVANYINNVVNRNIITYSGKDNYLRLLDIT